MSQWRINPLDGDKNDQREECRKFLETVDLHKILSDIIENRIVDSAFYDIVYLKEEEAEIPIK